MVGRRSGFRTRLAAVAAAVGVVAGTAWAGVVSVGAAAAVVIDVPCAGPGGGTPGLIAAIHAANSGGGTITLAPGCTYPLTSADNNNNGLPFRTGAEHVSDLAHAPNIREQIRHARMMQRRVLNRRGDTIDAGFPLASRFAAVA